MKELKTAKKGVQAAFKPKAQVSSCMAPKRFRSSEMKIRLRKSFQQLFSGLLQERAQGKSFPRDVLFSAIQITSHIFIYILYIFLYNIIK